MRKIRYCIVIAIVLINFTVTSFANIEEDIEEENYFSQIQEEIMQTAVDPNNVPKTISRAVVVYDRTSKTVIYGKNENDIRAMASTTKIMTATILLENEDLSKTIEVSKNAANTTGSRLGLHTGDKITLRDLLYGLMLVSGNDAAVQIAESVAGSVEEFAVLMNNKAQELGLTHTHFVTPHGLDNEEHYTTAYELAVLTDYALQNETFAKIVNTKRYTISIDGKPKNLGNTNELLGYLSGVNGVKTGFTNNAGRCLVTSTLRNNFNIITVVLGADTKKIRTIDSMRLIEYTYENYELVDISKIVEENYNIWKESYNIEVNKGINNVIQTKLGEQKYTLYPVNKAEKESIKIEIHDTRYFEAPLLYNTKLGYAEVFINGKSICTVDILADSEIRKKDVKDYFFILLGIYSSKL